MFHPQHFKIHMLVKVQMKLLKYQIKLKVVLKYNKSIIFYSEKSHYISTLKSTI